MRLTKLQKYLIAGFGCIGLLLLVSRLSSLKSDAAPETKNQNVVSTPSNQEKFDGPRFAIQRGAGGFKDREAVVELLRVKETTDEAERDRKLKELRIRQESEGRRIDINRDIIVRLVKEEAELKGFCEVNAEDPVGLSAQRFWIHKSALDGEDTPMGSQIITGYMIFRGKGNAVFVDNMPVRDLLDFIAGIYEGKISKKTALQCAFMPNVQLGDVQTVLDDYVIYTALYTSSRPIKFAVARTKGSRNPLKSGPLRYIGREEFTNADGMVFSIPVMVPVSGLK